MSLRLKRLWQPGNPQLRVFLPDFWVRIVESPKRGAGRLPKNCIKFEVDKRMSRHDVREYLEKIYELPVREVRTYVSEDIDWLQVNIRKYKKALWKEDERKYAFVYLKKGIDFEYPDLFKENEEEQELAKVKEASRKLEKPSERTANQYRKGAGTLLGV